MDFRPKKYLGQNFLVDKNIQKKIIRACQLTALESVLEIGAGRGELTRLIAEHTDKLIALEIDPYLCSLLGRTLKDSNGFRILNQDILRFSISDAFNNTKIKVIGNLPYNITTPIIVHLLKSRDKIKEIFITVQKEFAQRMVASPGSPDWSAFSIFLQYHSKPKILFFIKKTCFRPQPKVDSALVKLSIKDTFPLNSRRERYLFKIIRLSFQQRRKTLRNSLSGRISAERLNRYFNKYNIDKNIRAERLSLDDFINLINLK